MGFKYKFSEFRHFLSKSGNFNFLLLFFILFSIPFSILASKDQAYKRSRAYSPLTPPITNPIPTPIPTLPQYRDNQIYDLIVRTNQPLLETNNYPGPAYSTRIMFTVEGNPVRNIRTLTANVSDVEKGMFVVGFKRSKNNSFISNDALLGREGCFDLNSENSYLGSVCYKNSVVNAQSESRVYGSSPSIWFNVANNSQKGILIYSHSIAFNKNIYPLSVPSTQYFVADKNIANPQITINQIILDSHGDNNLCGTTPSKFLRLSSLPLPLDKDGEFIPTEQIGYCSFKANTKFRDSLYYALTSRSYPSPTPMVNPINWNTNEVSFQASDFYIVANGQKYFANTGNVRVSSDPGSSKYTTLEALWRENNKEMRLYIYFNSDGSYWWSPEFRTYNGNERGDWIYYYDKFFYSRVGSQYYNPKFVMNSSSNPNSSVFFKDLKITVKRFSPVTTPTPTIMYKSPINTIKTSSVRYNTNGKAVVDIFLNSKPMPKATIGEGNSKETAKYALKIIGVNPNDKNITNPGIIAETFAKGECTNEKPTNGRVFCLKEEELPTPDSMGNYVIKDFVFNDISNVKYKQLYAVFHNDYFRSASSYWSKFVQNSAWSLPAVSNIVYF